jgi:short-subunit dehydrogenase
MVTRLAVDQSIDAPTTCEPYWSLLECQYVEDVRTAVSTSAQMLCHIALKITTKAVLPHMRAQRSGRIINISSVLGLVPAPYMASYAATKHAIEGYSESVDHEVREHGVRVLLVEPAYTRTGFDANAVQPDAPLPIYAEQRRVFDGVMAAAMAGGDDPATVAKTIVAAATDPKPKLRYTAGSTARRVSALRRFVPAWAFDRQIRKLNHLPA